MHVLERMKVQKDEGHLPSQPMSRSSVLSQGNTRKQERKKASTSVTWGDLSFMFCVSISALRASGKVLQKLYIWCKYNFSISNTAHSFYLWSKYFAHSICLAS